jgi:hypothetical protein
VGLSGGLSAARSSPWELAAVDPFCLTNGLSAYAADWFAALSAAAAPVDAFELTLDAAFRSSAFGRGVFVVTDVLDTGSGILYRTERVTRNSLRTTIAAAWSLPWATLSAGWSAEWLDRLYLDSAFAIPVSITVFDSGADRAWETKLAATFAPDGTDLPVVSLSGQALPARGLTLSASAVDLVPFILGQARYIDGLYAAPSGVFRLSARVDF